MREEVIRRLTDELRKSRSPNDKIVIISEIQSLEACRRKTYPGHFAFDQVNGDNDPTASMTSALLISSIDKRIPFTPLTQAERIEIFKLAKRGLFHRCGEASKAGMSNADLRSALEKSLGLFGGSGSPNGPSVAASGAGFRI